MFVAPKAGKAAKEDMEDGRRFNNNMHTNAMSTYKTRWIMIQTFVPSEGDMCYKNKQKHARATLSSKNTQLCE